MCCALISTWRLLSYVPIVQILIRVLLYQYFWGIVCVSRVRLGWIPCNMPFIVGILLLIYLCNERFSVGQNRKGYILQRMSPMHCVSTICCAYDSHICCIMCVCRLHRVCVYNSGARTLRMFLINAPSPPIIKVTDVIRVIHRLTISQYAMCTFSKVSHPIWRCSIGNSLAVVSPYVHCVSCMSCEKLSICTSLSLRMKKRHTLPINF